METLKQHLKNRYLKVENHKCWIDDVERIATFPLYNLSGQLKGYQQYRPDTTNKKSNNPRESRYFTYKSKGEIAIWGLESWYYSDTLFLTEGLFDAARFTYNNVAAIAVLSNTLDKQTINWLWAIRKTRKVISVCDGDDSGKKLIRFGHDYYQFNNNHDASSASDEEIRFIINDYK